MDTAKKRHIKNPVEWIWARLVGTAEHMSDVTDTVRGQEAALKPGVKKIGREDLIAALRQGVEDLATFRSDVIFLCILYPIVGVAAVAAAFDYSILPLLFPAAAGFALVGPFAAVGLYEISRRRERGMDANWSHAFGVFASPSFGAILALGLALAGLFIFWILIAQALYSLTLGPEPPASLGAFVDDVVATPEGWVMAVLGILLGGLFAALVLAISFVSFPMLLDRKVGLRVAVATSLALVRKNPVTAFSWGAIVAGLLLIGSLPLFLGLIFVMPILGHATWHLYRRAVSFDAGAPAQPSASRSSG